MYTEAREEPTQIHYVPCREIYTIPSFFTIPKGVAPDRLVLALTCYHRHLAEHQLVIPFEYPLATFMDDFEEVVNTQVEYIEKLRENGWKNLHDLSEYAVPGTHLRLSRHQSIIANPEESSIHQDTPCSPPPLFVWPCDSLEEAFTVWSTLDRFDNILKNYYFPRVLKSYSSSQQVEFENPEHKGEWMPWHQEKTKTNDEFGDFSEYAEYRLLLIKQDNDHAYFLSNQEDDRKSLLKQQKKKRTTIIKNRKRREKNAREKAERIAKEQKARLMALLRRG